MTPLIAIVMGIVQGVTEFLPISSTAHLVLLPWLLGWPEPTHTFDVSLHAGTLVAVIWYFRRDWWELLTQGRRLIGLIALACVPAAVAGKLLDDPIEELVRLTVYPMTALLIAALVAGAGLVMWWADARGPKRLGMEKLSPWGALAIGLGQALALAPGVSRSGATITAALAIGLTREAAARFSFLLSTPIIGGAVLLKAVDLRHERLPAGEMQYMALGILAAAVAGYASIHVLIEYLKKRDLRVFVAYRLFLALVILAAYALKTQALGR